LLKATCRRSSTERNAACQHFFKTCAIELVEKLTKLWQMYSLYLALALGGVGQFRICSTCGCGLRAPCAKRKIKKRELTFKHISDARFTVAKGSGAGQTWVEKYSTKRLNGLTWHDNAWHNSLELEKKNV